MADNPRLEELRRRVQRDPASIAFAQLAEEHRRAGEFEEAIAVSRAGLEHHPTYLSARVTLGRALIALGRHEEATGELNQVLRVAPDNLTAIRALSDIHPGAEQRSHDADHPPASAGAGAAEIREQADAVLTELEGWLAAIVRDRAHRRADRQQQR